MENVLYGGFRCHCSVLEYALLPSSVFIYKPVFSVRCLWHIVFHSGWSVAFCSVIWTIVVPDALLRHGVEEVDCYLRDLLDNRGDKYNRTSKVQCILCIYPQVVCRPKPSSVALQGSEKVPNSTLESNNQGSIHRVVCPFLTLCLPIVRRRMS